LKKQNIKANRLKNAIVVAKGIGAFGQGLKKPCIIERLGYGPPLEVLQELSYKREVAD